MYVLQVICTLCIYTYVYVCILMSHIEVSKVTICDKIQIRCTKSNDVFFLLYIIIIEIGIIVLILYF